MTKTRLVVCVAWVALFGCGSSSNTPDAGGSTADAGADKTFTVTLNKAGEPTPCANATNATATATVTIAGDGSKITVTNFALTGSLSGPATLAHIHFGTTTQEGAAVLNFGASPTFPIASKVFTATDYSAGSGAPSTFADFVAMARAGGHAYLNVHTDMCKSGEIRGELQ